MGLGLLVESFDIAMMVGWAFAIAACSYFPLLLLGAWWRGLTKVGAGGGMLIGGLLVAGGDRLDDADRQEGDPPRRLAPGPLAAGAAGHLGRAALDRRDGRASRC